MLCADGMGPGPSWQMVLSEASCPPQLPTASRGPSPTSVPQNLPPQDLPYHISPHGLDLWRARLENVGVLGFPPPAEPDLKSHTTVPNGLRQADFSHLQSQRGRKPQRRPQNNRPLSG